MKAARWLLTMVALVLWISCTSPVGIAQPCDFAVEAKHILDATGVEGGLIDHIGCGDGKVICFAEPARRQVKLQTKIFKDEK